VRDKREPLVMAKVTMPGTDKWRTEEDLHHMTHAEEVRRDPKRLDAVKKLAAEKKSHLSRVASTSARKPASRKTK
jgi:hypothetical protein